MGSISCVAVDALMPSTISVLDKWLAWTMRESLEVEDSKGGQQDSGRRCRRHPSRVAVVPRRAT